MTTSATLTSKGQTTIPKAIRDSLGMKPGDEMTFTLMPGGTASPHRTMNAGSLTALASNVTVAMHPSLRL